MSRMEPETKEQIAMGGGLLLLAAVIIVVMFLTSRHGQKQHEKFKADHHCVRVGYVDGDVVSDVGVGVANGQAVVVPVTSGTSSKTGYKCDDGITYWWSE